MVSFNRDGAQTAIPGSNVSTPDATPNGTPPDVSVSGQVGDARQAHVSGETGSALLAGLRPRVPPRGSAESSQDVPTMAPDVQYDEDGRIPTEQLYRSKLRAIDVLIQSSAQLSSTGLNAEYFVYHPKLLSQAAQLLGERYVEAQELFDAAFKLRLQMAVARRLAGGSAVTRVANLTTVVAELPLEDIRRNPELSHGLLSSNLFWQMSYQSTESQIQRQIDRGVDSTALQTRRLVDFWLRTYPTICEPPIRDFALAVAAKVTDTNLVTYSKAMFPPGTESSKAMRIVQERLAIEEVLGRHVAEAAEELSGRVPETLWRGALNVALEEVRQTHNNHVSFQGVPVLRLRAGEQTAVADALTYLCEPCFCDGSSQLLPKLSEVGCHQRAHMLCSALRERGMLAGKIGVTSHTAERALMLGEAEWFRHIAPLVLIGSASEGLTFYVLDPVVSPSSPLISISAWLSVIRRTEVEIGTSNDLEFQVFDQVQNEPTGVTLDIEEDDFYKSLNKSRFDIRSFKEESGLGEEII